MLKFSSSLEVMAAANHSKNSDMETENHVKHGASSKSLTSRGNFLRRVCFGIFALMALPFVFMSCGNNFAEQLKTN